MEPSVLSRRAAIIGASAAGAASTSASALPSDPIFAAIERHRAAQDVFEAVCDCVDEMKAEAEGREVTDEDHARYIEASDRETAAAEAFATTPSTTVAGVRAALAYLVERFEILEPQRTTFDVLPALLASLAESPALAG